MSASHRRRRWPSACKRSARRSAITTRTSGDGACPVSSGSPATSRAVAAVDLVILVQHHREYDVEALQAASRLFLDTRGATRNGNRL